VVSREAGGSFEPGDFFAGGGADGFKRAERVAAAVDLVARVRDLLADELIPLRLVFRVGGFDPGVDELDHACENLRAWPGRLRHGLRFGLERERGHCHVGVSGR